MKELFAWSMVAATILLTTYGQLVIKWQASLNLPPYAFAEKMPQVVSLLLRPWVLSALFAAFAASVCWMMAVSRLELSRAYPFMAMNFLLVSLLAVPMFGENLSFNKILGLGLIVAGLIVGSRA